MKSLGWIELAVKPAAFGGIIVGGILFGIGMTVFGLCPGTGVAACGEGRRDAFVGVGGMLFGAGVYVAAYQGMQTVVKALGNAGKVTLPDLTHTAPWIWIAVLAAAAVALRMFMDRRLSAVTTRTAESSAVHRP